MDSPNRLVRLLLQLAADHLAKEREHEAVFTASLNQFCEEVDRRTFSKIGRRLANRPNSNRTKYGPHSLRPSWRAKLADIEGHATRQLTEEICPAEKERWSESPLHKPDLRTALTVALGLLNPKLGIKTKDGNPRLWRYLNQVRFGDGPQALDGLSAKLVKKLDKLDRRGFADELMEWLKQKSVNLDDITIETGKPSDVRSTKKTDPSARRKQVAQRKWDGLRTVIKDMPGEPILMILKAYRRRFSKQPKATPAIVRDIKYRLYKAEREQVH